MNDSEKKDRLSSEYIRTDPASPVVPVLPTVNPAAEKSEAPAVKLHAAFYVAYVFSCLPNNNPVSFVLFRRLIIILQNMDYTKLHDHYLQQMDIEHGRVS